ncbi:MAG: PAS domain S-box protein [Acidobacteriia bacterium]|nr:PAS domain S-box protein [Terriglobia bacterium]
MQQGKIQEAGDPRSGLREQAVSDSSDVALRKSEALFRALIENSSDAVALLDASLNVLYASPAADRLLGHSPGEIKQGFDLCHPQDHEKMAGMLKECVGNPGRAVHGVLRMRHKDGSWKCVEGTLTNLLDDPNVAGIVGYGRDITERVHAQEALRASEEKFKRAFGSSPDALTITTVAGGLYLEINEAFERLSGHTRADVIGKSAGQIGVWADPEDRVRILDELRKNGCVQSMETTFRRKDGTIFPAQMSAELIEMDGIQCMLAISRDVTALKQAEQDLRSSEEQYRSTIQQAPYGICRTVPEGRMTMVNSALVKLLGYTTAEEVLALNLARDVYRDPKDREQLMAMAHGRTPPDWPFSTVWKRKDGADINVQLAGRVILDERKQPREFEVFVEDVTKQQALESQLRMVQKMEAVGQLAGGVAHDFNNLVMIIGSRAAMILDAAGDQKHVVAQAEEIVRGTRRAAVLIKQLLAFSRKQVLQPSVVNLNLILAEMEKVLPRLIGENIEISITASPLIGKVKVDRGQFEQVVMNLAINARDAMPEGGKLVIETSAVELGEDFVSAHPNAQAGSYVLLAVKDSGAGMDQDTLARIFEPFFTTKGRGRGTGLGLAMVYGIVEQSGGFISVCSAPGQGTTFSIYLPVVAETSQVVQSEEVLPEPPGGTEAILVVEDEDALRTVCAGALRSRGYKVWEAANGAEALKICNAKPDAIQLLLTDVIMPGMSGAELSRQAKALHPNMRTIFMSGYSGTAVDSTTLQAPDAYLHKPFDMARLARQVRTTLDYRS